MAQPFVGEIRMFAGNFAPVGWNFCDGSLLAISQYSTLFNLIGTTYGGDGQTTFALPNLLGRVPVHAGSNGVSNYILGQIGGVENVTLTTPQIPSHTHLVNVSSNAGTANSPANNYFANWTGAQYSDQGPNTNLKAAVLGNAGSSQPHDNMVPFQAITFIISLFGIYPSQG